MRFCIAAGISTRDPYAMDFARALWKINGATDQAIPICIEKLEGQRNPRGPNKAIEGDFLSAIELLGEIGPAGREATPILTKNLKGGARFNAAWALWRIDSERKADTTRVLTDLLDDESPEQKVLRVAKAPFSPPFWGRSARTPFNVRLSALGALWQMFPEKRNDLMFLIAGLLREWETDPVLKKLTPEAQAAVQAISGTIE